MSVFLIIVLVLILLAMWLRRLWRRDPMRILRFLFRIPQPPKESRRESRRRSGASRERGRQGRRSESIIPKEYAEDVEFTETRDYSSDRFESHSSVHEEYHEHQVSDAEWEDIK